MRETNTPAAPVESRYYRASKAQAWELVGLLRYWRAAGIEVSRARWFQTFSAAQVRVGTVLHISRNPWRHETVRRTARVNGGFAPRSAA